MSYLDKAKQELVKRGLRNHTLDQAHNALMIGWITQDDYDLFHDCWSTGVFRFSLQESAIKESHNRLKERFS